MTGRFRVTVWAAVATLASAASLHGVFRGWGWMLPVLGAVVVVFAAAEAVRRSRVPDMLAPLAATAVVVLYLTALYARTPGRDGLVPTKKTFTVLGDVARTGFHDVQALSTPVPTHQGLVLLAVVGVAAVALVVDLLAVTMRRASLAGVPLLAVFAVATATSAHGAGVISFCIAAAGYLGLLLADSRDRLSRWGRAVDAVTPVAAHYDSTVDGPVPPPLSVLSRRIGLAAVALGALVPLLVPGLRGGVPQHGSTHLGSGDGGSIAVTVNPIVGLQGQLQASPVRPLLLVHSDGATPDYLRLTALEQFDGNVFSPDTLHATEQQLVSRGLPPPTVPGVEHHTTIDVRALATPWLPVPQPATSVDVTGDWRYDQETETVFSSRQNTEGAHYTVTSLTPTLDRVAVETATTNGIGLPASLRSVPDALPASVRALTQRVTANAATPYDKAMAIQDFLTSNKFVYDTTAPQALNGNALANFLLRSRRGFCQQFATAMAVMARLSGIPARVAIGFTPGDPQPGGSLLVTTRDAHAWPELWFDGLGWLPFEPTPRSDGQVQTPRYARPVLHPQGNQGPHPVHKKGGSGDHHGKSGKHHASQVCANGYTKQCTFDQRADTARHHRHKHRGLAATPKHSIAGDVALIVLAVIGLLLLLPASVRIVGRRRRWHGARSPADRADAAWEELRSTSVDLGLDWESSRSARVTARCLEADAGLAGDAAASMHRLVSEVERAWYAAGPTAVGTDTLPEDVAAVCARLRAGVPWTTRLRVLVWPRSAVQAVWGRLADAAGLLDAVDLAGARLRARIRARLRARTAG